MDLNVLEGKTIQFLELDAGQIKFTLHDGDIFMLSNHNRSDNNSLYIDVYNGSGDVADLIDSPIVQFEKLPDTEDTYLLITEKSGFTIKWANPDVVFEKLIYLKN